MNHAHQCVGRPQAHNCLAVVRVIRACRRRGGVVDRGHSAPLRLQTSSTAAQKKKQGIKKARVVRGLFALWCVLVVFAPCVEDDVCIYGSHRFFLFEALMGPKSGYMLLHAAS